MVICVLKCIGAIVSSLVIFSDEMRSLGSGFTAFLAIELIITFVWIAGVWKMRKWGVLTYLMLTAAVQGVSSKMGVWSPGDFVKSAILLSILFWHFPRMK